ncbi:heterokaryon incompatibility protein-domain-containing protein [Xylariaceae sp. FL0662B]|nr:heterokaryon incompatibility protein-domain-containing protein [Xylariaceae sp. FL0662B]
MDMFNSFIELWNSRGVMAAPGYCKACTAMLGTAEGIKGICSANGYRHLTPLECLRSAECGCKLCRMIYEHGWKKFRGPVPKATDTKKKLTRLHFFAESDDRDRQRSILPWKIKRVDRDIKGDPAASILPRRPVSECLMADNIMDGISSWLRDCTTSNGHDGCVYTGKPELPTRVLDVGQPRDGKVKLYPNEDGTAEDYVALSYCWGGPQPLTANNGNMRQLVDGIELSALPQTLQDAVLATRRLGFRYLWVDAICIIQDNDEDKMREIGRMGKIYRNATVTIVASYSRSASGGFLKPDIKLAETPSCTMPFWTPTSDTKGTVTIALETEGKRPIQPLSTRGWAYQEAVLSPRLVAFSEFEVYCECHRRNREVFNSGSRRHIKGGRLYAPDLRLLADIQEARRDHGDGWMDEKYLAEIWENAVVQFTLRALTVADDRLPGVQGLANEIAEHLGHGVGGSYVAGVWTKCLPRLLLWCRSDVPPVDLQMYDAEGNFLPSRAAQQRTRSARAPSWSWASLDCPVRFFSDEGDRYDATVSVRRDWCLSPLPEALQSLELDPTSTEIVEIECEILMRTSDEIAEDIATGNARIAMDLELDEMENGDNNVCYLFLSKNFGPDNWDRDIKPMGPLRLWYSSGLVVFEVAEGLFRRMGYFRWDHGDLVDGVEPNFGERQSVRLI